MRINNKMDKINEIAQKHISQVLDQQKKIEIKEELNRLYGERDLINQQILELKKLIKSDQNRKYSMNIQLGFVSRSNMFQ